VKLIFSIFIVPSLRLLCYFVRFMLRSIATAAEPVLGHTRRITSCAHRPHNQSKTREQPNIDPARSSLHRHRPGVSIPLRSAAPHLTLLHRVSMARQTIWKEIATIDHTAPHTQNSNKACDRLENRMRRDIISLMVRKLVYPITDLALLPSHSSSLSVGGNLLSFLALSGMHFQHRSLAENVHASHRLQADFVATPL
jgi:hypothetical protein